MWNISWWRSWWVTVLLPYLLNPHRTGFAWSFAPVLRNCIFWTAAPLLGNQLTLSPVSRGHQRFPPLCPRSSNQRRACLSRATRGREPECCRPHPALCRVGGIRLRLRDAQGRSAPESWVGGKEGVACARAGAFPLAVPASAPALVQLPTPAAAASSR